MTKLILREYSYGNKQPVMSGGTEWDRRPGPSGFLFNFSRSKTYEIFDTVRKFVFKISPSQHLIPDIYLRLSNCQIENGRLSIRGSESRLQRYLESEAFEEIYESVREQWLESINRRNFEDLSIEQKYDRKNKLLEIKEIDFATWHSIRY